MKKSVLAAALAAVVMLSGCSGVSQENYNSLVEENSRLQSENSNLKETNNNSEDNDGEYAMPKDHVKRISKVMGLTENSCITHEAAMGLDIEQYNKVDI